MSDIKFSIQGAVPKVASMENHDGVSLGGTTLLFSCKNSIMKRTPQKRKRWNQIGWQKKKKKNRE